MANNTGQAHSAAASFRKFVNIVRIVGAIVLMGIAVSGVLSLISFYRDEVGLSAPAAAEEYAQALLEGNLDTVYTMTDQASLTDLYGRPVSRTEFMAQARELVGSEPLPVQTLEVAKLYVNNGVHYYQVDITYLSGSSVLEKHLLLEMRNEEGTWLVTWPFGLGS